MQIFTQKLEGSTLGDSQASLNKTMKFFFVYYGNLDFFWQCLPASCIVGVCFWPMKLQQTLRDNLLARPPKRVDRRRGTKCVGLKCICVVKTLSRGIICIKTSFFLFFSNFGFRETLISSPGILKDRSSSNIQCPEGSYNTQQIMNTRCFLGD